MATHNPQIQPPLKVKNAAVQPGASDFVETPEVDPTPPSDHERFPLWLYLVCGVALFLAGSSFTGFAGSGFYDQGPGAPVVASAGGAAAVKKLDPMAMGKNIYNGNCANCHQASGEGQPGSYPPMVGSEWVLGDKACLTAIMLHGVQGPLVVKGASFGSQQMPAWATVLSDEKIADVMTYIRQSWGNKGDPVTSDDVSKFRAQFGSQSDAYTQPSLEKMEPKK